MFVSNKSQNGWTNQSQIFVGTSRESREGLKNLPLTKFDFWKFRKSTKFFLKICEIFCFLFYNVYKEKMFTIKVEDGREVPCKLSIHYLRISWTKFALKKTKLITPYLWLTLHYPYGLPKNRKFKQQSSKHRVIWSRVI